MNAVHDLGGTPGWGALHPPRPDEPPFSEDWERRAFALALLSMRVSGTNIDAFRYSLERLDRYAYLDDGYYGRWLNGAENLLLDSAIIAPGAIDARARAIRGEQVEEPAVPEPRRPDYTPTAAPVDHGDRPPPPFAVGDKVRVRNTSPARAHESGWLRARARRHRRGRAARPRAARHQRPFRGREPSVRLHRPVLLARAVGGADIEPFDVTIDIFTATWSRAMTTPAATSRPPWPCAPRPSSNC